MARRVFFSFDFKRDAARVSQVRNSQIIGSNYDKPPFLDHADWEKIERQGDSAIKTWIDDQLVGSSVTVVLIGANTSNRRWVRYEIEKSWDRGNGLVGIYIHNIKGFLGTDTQGINPFAGIRRSLGAISMDLASFVKTYDWVDDDGRNKIGQWIEGAAKQRGK